MPAKAFNVCVHLRMPSYTPINMRKLFQGAPTDSQRKRNTGNKMDSNHNLDPSTEELTSDQTNSAHLWVCKKEIDVAISINAAIAKTYGRVYFLLHQKSLPIDGGRYYSPKILSFCSHISQC